MRGVCYRSIVQQNILLADGLSSPPSRLPVLVAVTAIASAHSAGRCLPVGHKSIKVFRVEELQLQVRVVLPLTKAESVVEGLKDAIGKR